MISLLLHYPLSLSLSPAPSPSLSLSLSLSFVHYINKHYMHSGRLSAVIFGYSGGPTRVRGGTSLQVRQ